LQQHGFQRVAQNSENLPIRSLRRQRIFLCKFIIPDIRLFKKKDDKTHLSKIGIKQTCIVR